MQEDNGDALRKTVSRIISKCDETWYQAIPQRWVVITRSVSEKMDNILKNYEVLVLCAPAYG